MFKRGFLRFRRDESGSLSVEALFWLTLVCVTMAIFVDSTAIFTAQGRVLRVVHDANRAYSLGFLTSEAQVVEYIQTRLAPVSDQVVAETKFTGAQGNIIYTRVQVPARGFEVFGTIPALAGLTVTAYSKHVIDGEWSG